MSDNRLFNSALLTLFLVLLLSLIMLSGCAVAPAVDDTNWNVFDITIGSTRYFPAFYWEQSYPMRDEKTGCIRFFTDKNILQEICNNENMEIRKWGTLQEFKAFQGIDQGIDNFWKNADAAGGLEKYLSTHSSSSYETK